MTGLLNIPWGMDIHVVEPGTIVRDEETGEEAMVTETNVVFKARGVYVIQSVYEALKANTLECGS